jgi:uncharacterized membrane protein
MAAGVKLARLSLTVRSVNAPGSFMAISATALFPLPSAVWPFLLGIIPLLIGLAVIVRGKRLRASGVEKAIVFGGVLLAAPMGVFSGDHFTAPQVIVTMVPDWIPWHMFWAYFVGAALLAAALSIAAEKFSALAAALLGFMLFCFVWLLHVPAVIASPGRIITMVLLRDLSFSGGAFVLAATRADDSGTRWRKGIAAIRLFMGFAAVVYGVEHFLYPQHVPVIPLPQLLPAWIPAHIAISYTTGAIMIACALCLLANWRARLAAAWLGIVVIVLCILIYLPITLAKPSDIANGLNYLADTLAYAGAMLALAGALPVAD